MVANRTVTRLQEAADLLALVEDALTSHITSNSSARTSVNSGLKITVRAAREAVLRSFVELRRESKAANHEALDSQDQPTPSLPPLAPSSLEAQRSPPKEGNSAAFAIELERVYKADLPRDAGEEREPAHERLLNRKRDLKASIDRMVQIVGERVGE